MLFFFAFIGINMLSENNMSFVEKDLLIGSSETQRGIPHHTCEATSNPSALWP